MRPGRGSHQHWYISAAYGLVSIKLDPPRIDVFKRQAVDRVGRLLYKILSLQDPNDEYLADEVSHLFHAPPFHLAVKFEENKLTKLQVMLGNDSTPATARVNVASNAGIGEASALPSDAFSLRLDGVDFGNTSEWMLDDFWHFNDFSAAPFDN